MSKFSSFALLSLLLIVARSSSDLDFKVLQTFGRARSNFVKSIRIPDGTKPIGAHLGGIDRRIATGVFIKQIMHQASGGRAYNVSGYIEADGNLGYTEFMLVVTFDNGNKMGYHGSLDVIGVRFEGKHGSIYTGRNLQPAYLEDCILSPNSMDVRIVRNSLVINPRKQSKLPKLISISCPRLSLDGEIAEFEIET